MAVGTAVISAACEVPVPVTALASSNLGTVTNLAVGGVADNAVTLSFTEVTNGAGQAASYDVRYAGSPIAWGAAASVTQGSCATPLVGSAIGATRSCTVLGLTSATGYQFQLVAFRGTLNVDAVFGAVSNVASGTTTGTPVPVASVTVSPAAASVVAGQTVQLSATPKDVNGTPLTGRVITWTSNALGVATVSPGGLVTGVVAGAATITATSEGVNGTAALTVTAPPPPPPPGTWPNEPAGLTPITDWSFSALSGSGWSGWGGTLGVDPTAPASPPSNWEVLFPIGFVAGNSPGQRNFGFAPLPTELFIGVWWKPSNPWQYQSVGDKIFYVTDITGGGSGLFFLQQGGAPHNLTVTTQTGAENRNLATVAQTPITLGVWHRIEMYLTWSTTGTGIVRWWVDGILQGNVTDVRWQNGTGFATMHMDPVWGGIGGTKAENDYFWYDHVYLSGR